MTIGDRQASTSTTTKTGLATVINKLDIRLTNMEEIVETHKNMIEEMKKRISTMEDALPNIREQFTTLQEYVNS